MDVELTKAFSFSSSYTIGSRSIGRNFVLRLTVRALSEDEERALESLVEQELVSHLHTRDLSQNVDFLKNVEKTDQALLRAFWERLSRPLAPYGPKRLALERDAHTVTTLSV